MANTLSLMDRIKRVAAWLLFITASIYVYIFFSPEEAVGYKGGIAIIAAVLYTFSLFIFASLKSAASNNQISKWKAATHLFLLSIIHILSFFFTVMGFVTTSVLSHSWFKLITTGMTITNTHATDFDIYVLSAFTLVPLTFYGLFRLMRYFTKYIK